MKRWAFIVSGGCILLLLCMLLYYQLHPFEQSERNLTTQLDRQLVSAYVDSIFHRQRGTAEKISQTRLPGRPDVLYVLWVAAITQDVISKGDQENGTRAK